MLSKEDKQDIADLVAASVRVSLEDACICGLSDEAQRELSHLMGMCSDLGDGKHAKGIEQIREAIKFSVRWRLASEKVGSAVLLFIFLTITGGIFMLLREGFRWWVKQ